MIPNPCIEVQTYPEARPSVPPWFAEVVIIAYHLTTHDLLDAFAQLILAGVHLVTRGKINLPFIRTFVPMLCSCYTGGSVG